MATVWVHPIPLFAFVHPDFQDCSAQPTLTNVLPHRAPIMARVRILSIITHVFVRQAFPVLLAKPMSMNVHQGHA
jgi:hypothetical protein